MGRTRVRLDASARGHAAAAGNTGATAVQYALMIAIVALLLIGGFYMLIRGVGGVFSASGDCVASVDCPAGGGGGQGGGPAGGLEGDDSTAPASSTTTTPP